MCYPKRLFVTAAVLFSGAAAFCQTKFHVSVFTSGAATFQTTSTLIEGPKNTLLINAQFTQSDAAKLVEKIKASGKNLLAIFITSASPENYFGLGTLKAAFPKAKIWAIPSTITGMNAGFADEVKRWTPLLGAAEVPDRPIIPFGVPGASIILDNEQVQVFGPVQGDVEGCSYVFIPGNKTLIAGDIVYNNVHAFTGNTNADQRKQWLDALDKLKKLGPIMVVAGHKDPAAPDDVSAIDGTIQYLKIYDKAVKASHSSDELINIMDDQLPDLKGLDTALKISAAKQFPDKN